LTQRRIFFVVVDREKLHMYCTYMLTNYYMTVKNFTNNCVYIHTNLSLTKLRSRHVRVCGRGTSQPPTRRVNTSILPSANGGFRRDKIQARVPRNHGCGVAKFWFWRVETAAWRRKRCPPRPSENSQILNRTFVSYWHSIPPVLYWYWRYNMPV